jgi:hypothetical protein
MFDESDLQVVDDEGGYDELSHSTHVAFDYTDDMLDDM